MIYLGLHNSAEAGAALVVNNKVVSAAHEERFVRTKNFHGWPTNAIAYVLNQGKLDISQVDRVVYGMIEGPLPNEETLKRIVTRIAEGVAKNPKLAQKYHQRIASEIDWNKQHLEELHTRANNEGWADKLFMQDHHLSHAAAAYFCGPFDEAFVFTCDGKGGFRTSTSYKGSSNALIPIDFTTTFDSAGYFYGNVTKALGFQAERHEGKVTGLAAHGYPGDLGDKLAKVLSTRKGRLHCEIGELYLPWFCEAEDLPAMYKIAGNYEREDIAAAAQHALERAVCGWISTTLRTHSNKTRSNICLAGGVIGNVKLNQRIRELPEVQNVYVHPAMGDGGLPLGGIFAQMMQDGCAQRQFLPRADLGPEFSNEEIEKTLTEAHWKYIRPESVVDELQRLFAERRPVGLFRGRMEYGPRALYNRSIIYHGRDASVNVWLNKKLNRSEFMPFAPVTTAEVAPECFVDWSEDDPAADFMTMTYDCTEWFKTMCPACVHIDGTARPQIVRKDIQPQLHALLESYIQSTGEPAIINTSFNNHEEPINCSIEDALRSLSIGNVDALLIGDFLVESRPTSTHLSV